MKGERRFIATIARRLDTLGAITRGQRDSQSAMGEGNAMFRPEDNLESPYAKAALRRLYIALWRGNIPDWSLERFETATGLSLTYEGGLKEDLPPMPKFLNRLLALPIAEQNALFAELEERIAALVAEAMESGSYDRGVETVHADSLVLASREPVFTHEATGAVTELCEIQRRDKLEPLTAEAALGLRAEAVGAGRETRLMTNERSHRAALVLPHVARMLEDGGVEERVRLVRPAARETMARAELDASTWREADEEQWRALWEAEIGGLPSHTESRFWLVTGLLLPIWDRVPDRNMRVRPAHRRQRRAHDRPRARPRRGCRVPQRPRPRRRAGADPGRAVRRDHGSRCGVPAGHRRRSRVAARAAKPDGRPSFGDRGAGGRRCRRPQAHGAAQPKSSRGAPACSCPMRTCSNASSRAIRSPNPSPCNGRRFIHTATAGHVVFVTVRGPQHDKETDP